MSSAREITIRDAALDDALAVHALYAHNVETGFASYEYAAPNLDEMIRRIETLLQAGYPYLIAEIDGAFAGYAYASSYRSRAGYRWTVENSVYVASHYGGRGVGRRLMQSQ
jgi:L-amino acid N-acyltransferase YncA